MGDLIMKIKAKFLNEESLKSYGFKKNIISEKYGICEYEIEDEECCATILIQRGDGEVAIVFNFDDCDCTSIPNVVFHLIKDGLVTI